MRIMADSLLAAPQGAIDSVGNLESWVRRYTILENTTFVADEARAVLRNRPSQRMRAAMEMRSSLPALLGLSQLVSCTICRAKRLLDEARRLELNLSDLASGKTPERGLALRNAEKLRLSRMSDLMKVVPQAAARAWWTARSEYVSRPLDRDTTQYGVARTSALSPVLMGSARRGEPTTDLYGIQLLVVAPPHTTPSEVADALLERLRFGDKGGASDSGCEGGERTPDPDFVFVKKDTPGPWVTRIEGLACVTFEDKKGGSTDESATDGGGSASTVTRRVWQAFSIDVATLNMAPARALFLTGPPCHYEHMRAESKAQGYRLDATSFVRTKQPGAGGTGAIGEDDTGIYRALGFEFVKPNTRSLLPSLVLISYRKRKRPSAAKRRKLRRRLATKVDHEQDNTTK